jgi:hypothetical protein
VELVTKPLTKEDWIDVFAPGYKPMAEDIDRAALDLVDIGLLEAPEEVLLLDRDGRFSFVKELPEDVKRKAVEDTPDSIEMCRICKHNSEKRGTHWPPCNNPLLNKQFQYDVMDASGAFDDLSPDDKYEKLLELNPVMWAESEFTFELDGIKRAWSARWYQELFMLCSNPDRCAVWGRRMGKSEACIILCLHAAEFRPGASSSDREYGIHAFAHSENLQEKHFREFTNFLDNSRSLKNKLASRGSKKDSLIMFDTGSSIAFHVISGKQRGVSGKFLWFDEAAFYRDEGAIAAAMGLRLESGGADTVVLMTSNSSGFMGRFYRFAQKPETFMTQLTAHYNPGWNIRMELLARSEFTEEEYEREVEAKWGESAQAVFSPKHIDSIKELFPYSYAAQEERLAITLDKQPGTFRVLGCDWNEGINGVHFCIVEYNPHLRSGGEAVFKLIHKSIITGDEWSHTRARMEAFDLLTGWNCDAAYLDWGGGGSQSVPDLKRMLSSSGYGKLVRNIIAIDMGKTIDIPDPFEPNLIYKVPQKNVMVKKTQQLLQQRRLAIPEEEFLADNPKQRNNNVVPQMRDFRVERLNSKGQAVYSSDLEEHTLTAYMLAVYGGMVSCTDILVPDNEVHLIQKIKSKDPLTSSNKNKKTENTDDVRIAIARNRDMPGRKGGMNGVGLGSRTHGMRPTNRRDGWR